MRPFPRSGPVGDCPTREVIPRGRIRLVPNLDMSLKCERRDMSHDVDWAAIGR